MPSKRVKVEPVNQFRVDLMGMDATAVLRERAAEMNWSVYQWQKQLLEDDTNWILVNGNRGSAKSQTAMAKCVNVCILDPNQLCIVISDTQDHAKENVRHAKAFTRAMGMSGQMIGDAAGSIEFANGSRILCQTATEKSARTYHDVRIFVIDEAARVPDDVQDGAEATLDNARGQMIKLSTPYGPRGRFHGDWYHADTERINWRRFLVTLNPKRLSDNGLELPVDLASRGEWHECSHIANRIFFNALRHGRNWLLQEYYGSFMALSGLVFPDFSKCLIAEWPKDLKEERCRCVGGIDWGWNDPFAAVWGLLDETTDILYLHDEMYRRFTDLNTLIDKPLIDGKYALKELASTFEWWYDPSRPQDAMEFRRAGFRMHPGLKGKDSVRAGIAAITARIQTNRLKVLAPHMLNLVEEAKLYRYDEVQEGEEAGEIPLQQFDHLIDALRYMVMGIDKGFVAQYRRKKNPNEIQDRRYAAVGWGRDRSRPWLRADNDALFTVLSEIGGPIDD